MVRSPEREDVTEARHCKLGVRTANQNTRANRRLTTPAELCLKERDNSKCRTCVGENKVREVDLAFAL